MGAAVRSEAWAAAPASSNKVATVASSGGSTPRRAAKAVIHSVPVGVASADMRRTYRGGMAEERRSLRVSGSLSIPLSELAWRFSRSGGPGGQHANTADTRVEVRFDVEGSPSLGPRQRARLLERVGPEVRVVAADERSQARNRALAQRRLGALLAVALRVGPA